MSEAVLIASVGARKVEKAELALVPVPPPSGRHYPVAHNVVADAVENTLIDAAFNIQKAEYALTQEGQQMFATYTLSQDVGGTAVLAVGLRTSFNKTLPLGLVAGSRVLVCSNLQFRSDLINVRRLHTKHGNERFTHDIAGAVSSLTSFREAESRRLLLMQQTKLDDDTAQALILRSAVDEGIIPVRLLPDVLKEYREPTYDEFRPRTVFSLFNAYTTVLVGRRDRNPNEYARTTMKLNSFLFPTGDSPRVSTQGEVLSLAV